MLNEYVVAVAVTQFDRRCGYIFLTIVFVKDEIYMIILLFVYLELWAMALSTNGGYFCNDELRVVHLFIWSC